MALWLASQMSHMIKLLLISDSNPGKSWQTLRRSTLELHCSRIPTDVFRSIVVDMDIMLMQYGPLFQHKMEEATFRFFSPVFNHLVKLFTFVLRNQPETTIEGRIGKTGRIEYFFKTFGVVAILCVELKLKIGNDDERLAAIAQVIAECDGKLDALWESYPFCWRPIEFAGCHLNNAKNGFSLPIYCLLCDGLSFESFKFERNTNPTFRRVAFMEIRSTSNATFESPISKRRALFRSFSTFAAYAKRSLMSCWAHTSLDWGHTISDSQQTGRSRARRDRVLMGGIEHWNLLKTHQRCLIHSANTTVEEALFTLKDSTGAVPTIYHLKFIMSDWDYAAVEKRIASFF